MRLPPSFRHTGSMRQRGSFLLESLIAILIVALGVLGLVGLQARAMQDTDESQYRSEAAFLASDVVSRMWLHNPNTLEADFDTGGVQHAEFLAVVQKRLPGSVNPPTIAVTPRVIGSVTNGFDVVVTVFWRPPSAAWEHSHRMDAVVRMN